MRAELNRREFTQSLGAGFGAVALTDLLANSCAYADEPKANLNGGLHHPAKVKRVIQLFMNGGASQMDLFDYKPELSKRHGQKFDPGTEERVEAATSEPGNVLGSPFAWQQHGECGRWVSDQLPHTARHVDDLALFLGLTSRT